MRWIPSTLKSNHSQRHGWIRQCLRDVQKAVQQMATDFKFALQILKTRLQIHVGLRPQIVDELRTISEDRIRPI